MNGLYELEFLNDVTIASVEKESDLLLWHQRMGHLNIKSLKFLKTIL